MEPYILDHDSQPCACPVHHSHHNHQAKTKDSYAAKSLPTSLNNNFSFQQFPANTATPSASFSSFSLSPHSNSLDPGNTNSPLLSDCSSFSSSDLSSPFGSFSFLHSQQQQQPQQTPRFGQDSSYRMSARSKRQCFPPSLDLIHIPPQQPQPTPVNNSNSSHGLESYAADAELQFPLDNDNGGLWESSNQTHFYALPNVIVDDPMMGICTQGSFHHDHTSSVLPRLVIDDYDDGSFNAPAQDYWSMRQQSIDLTSPPMSTSPPTKKRSGRNKPLSEVSRVHAAMMRRRVACHRCKAARCKCGIHDPCKACVTKFGALILREPCREPLVPRCLNLLLPIGMKWCPAPKKYSDIFGPNHQKSNYELAIPINFGYGTSPMNVNIRIIAPDPDVGSRHLHWVYPFPAYSSSRGPVACQDVVLPAGFSSPASLATTLNRHLDILVDEQPMGNPNICHKFFDQRGEFVIIGILYNVYQHYSQNDARIASLLKTSLKLLTLIHLPDLISVDPSEPAIQQILQYASPSRRSNTYGNSANSPIRSVTPCALRSSFGEVMPELMHKYLNDVLQGLFTLTLFRNCEHFLAVHAITAILTLALETLQATASKADLHNPVADSMSAHLARSSVEEGIAVIQRLYRICFGECHRRLLLTDLPSSAPIAGDAQQAGTVQAQGVVRGRRRRTSSSSSAPKRPDPHTPAALPFTRRLNRAVSDARAYLEHKAAVDFPDRDTASGQSPAAVDDEAGTPDLSVFRDRWVARMYLLAAEDEWDSTGANAH